MKHVQIVSKTIYLLLPSWFKIPAWCFTSSYVISMAILKVQEVKLGRAGENVKFHHQRGISAIFDSWRKERKKYSLQSSLSSLVIRSPRAWLNRKFCFLCAVKKSGKCVINRAEQVSGGCSKECQSNCTLSPGLGAMACDIRWPIPSPCLCWQNEGPANHSRNLWSTVSILLSAKIYWNAVNQVTWEN